MTERTKIFTLPDLLPAPHSDVGAMARTLIEYADLSVVPALLDELERACPAKAQRFREEITHLSSSCVRAAQSQYLGPVPHWDWAVDIFIRLFWFDLFDLTDSMAVVETAITRQLPPNPDVQEYTPHPPQGPMRYRATVDISAGQYIELRRPELQAVLADNQGPDPVPESQQDE